jgi:hypothetical protein
MCMASDQRWWFCLRHMRPEPDDKTDAPGKDLLGPYLSQEEASRALEKVRERNQAWDAQDELPLTS